MRARTPMLQQYFDAKAQHPGVLIAMRVGDFYEFYGEDAVKAAELLEITLTGRDDAENGRIPMAGVPYHSVEKYLAKIVSSGQKVALCDQVEDPKTAKGLVKREVTRVLTPGTVLEDSMLQAGKNNFLAALMISGGAAGLATLDLSTGEFLVTNLPAERMEEMILQELSRLAPNELLLDESSAHLQEVAKAQLGIAVTDVESMATRRGERILMDHFDVSSLESFGLTGQEAALQATAAVLSYARHNGLELGHVQSLGVYSTASFMALDPATRRALEISSNLMDGSRKFTLLSVVDQTVTAVGSRLLRRWLEQPLLDLVEIQARLDAVEVLIKSHLDRADLRDALKGVGDLERLVARCSAQLAGPRDLAALKSTLANIPILKSCLLRFAVGRVAELSSRMGDHSVLAELLARSVVPEPPHALRDGGVIADGFDPELDALRELSREGRKFIAEIEQQERERTQIPSLKIGYNSVFGYYLEVSKTHLGKVPENYVRKQTTVNAERFFTAELKDREATVLGASERAQALEVTLFNRIRTEVAHQAADLLHSAKAIAEVDALTSFAEVSSARGYRKPIFAERDVLQMDAGRHPVVESHRPQFVPNDISLDENLRIMLITGPNMSGKSTYLRQVALITLLAQAGCFVPAKRSEIGLCDRIFARIGAKDEIALGQSTFMVEMVESAYILHHATDRSLVLFDEVGRGTSTYDGLAIAWAMIEYLSEIGCKTLFATHYHPLNALADSIPTIKNFRVSVREVGDDIIWTHRVLPGGTDKSYGIHVARKAGMPKRVLQRAQGVLTELEGGAPISIQNSPVNRIQLTLFDAEDPRVIRELKELDVNTITPIQALQLLGDWKEQVRSDAD